MVDITDMMIVGLGLTRSQNCWRLIRTNICFPKILCSLLFAFCSLPSYGQGEIVQGPFKIDGEKAIYFQSESNSDFPLGLYYDSGTKKTQVDKYEMDGDTPNVDTVFFMKIHNVKNVVVLISWHQLHQAESINGNTYQVYTYKYVNDSLTLNDVITKDPALNGMDGEFNGDEEHFKYKDAASIKQYINSKYNWFGLFDLNVISSI